jgi:prolyl oligopeptidase
MTGCSRHSQVTAPIRSISYVADTYFYIKTDSANAHETLMARKRSDATGRNLVDLGSLLPGKSGSNFEIQPSGDGKFLAIGIPTGNEGYSIRVMNVATTTMLPDSISLSFDGDASWSDSNDMFYYRRIQQGSNGATPEAVFTNMRAYSHKLGDDQSLDKPVFGPDINPELRLPVVGAVNAFPVPGTSLLLAVQSSSPKELDSFWVHDIEDAGTRWRKIIDHTDDVIFNFSTRASALYFITQRNSPSGQLMELDVAHEDVANARELLPASDVQLSDRDRDGVLCAKDALYVYGHRNGISTLLRVSYDDPTQSAEVIKLPFAGVIANVTGDFRTPGVVFSLSGLEHPFAVYEYDPSLKMVVDTRLVQ